MSGAPTIDFTRYFDELYEKIPLRQRKICENSRAIVFGKPPTKRKPEKNLPITDQMNQHLVSIGLILDRIVECAFEIAVALFQKLNKPGSDELILSAITSCFGYFSSNEQLIRACQFYEEVMNHALPASSVLILAPLLNSIATFPFIESFLREVSMLPNDSKIDDRILEILRKNLVLLPEPVIELIRRSKSNSHFQDLIWHSFLEKQIELWCSLFPTTATKKLKSVFENFFSKPTNVAAAMKLFSKTKGQFTLPSFLWSNDQLYLPQLMTVSDTCRIVDLLKDAKVLPDTIPESVFSRPLDGELEFSFWVKHYVRQQVSEEKDFRFLDEKFEIYARMKMNLCSLDEFLRTTKRCLRLNGYPTKTSCAVERANVLFEAAKYVNSRALRKIDDEYNAVVESSLQIAMSMPQSVELRIAELCGGMDKLPMYERLRRAMEIVKIIIEEKLSNAPDVVSFLLLKYGVTQNVSTILVVNNVLCSLRSRIIEHEELALWGNFVTWCVSFESSDTLLLNVESMMSKMEVELRKTLEGLTRRMTYCI